MGGTSPRAREKTRKHGDSGDRDIQEDSEASTISEWVARLLEGLGHEVVVGDSNYAPMYAQRSA